MKNKFQNNLGQVVLILVLITVVGLTIGLSLISRSITDVRISSQIEQSSRAFSAAEAGVESALRGAVVGGPTGTVTLPGASADYNVTGLGGSGDTYVLPVAVVNTTQTVWLIPHNDDGSINEDGTPYPANSSLDICWGTEGSGEPAVLLTLIYKEGAIYKIAKGAYDSIVRGNNFDPSELAGGYCDGNFRYRKQITPTTDFGVASSATLLALRVQSLYSSTPIAIKPKAGQTLPLQGKKITSVGQTETGIARKVQVIEAYKSLPSVFDFTLFSEN